jgi:hypothetical protein
MSVASKEYIEELRRGNRWRIDETLEAMILEEFSEEPYPHSWTDQDLYEQIRKLVMNYNASLPPEPLPF